MACIFVLDHETMLLELISAVLRSDGHVVKLMTDASIAFKEILVARTSVDLIITDIDLRPISGTRLVSHLRRESIDCPVIFMSEHHRLARIITHSLLGQYAVLEKPFTASEVRAATKKALAAGGRTARHTP